MQKVASFPQSFTSLAMWLGVGDWDLAQWGGVGQEIKEEEAAADCGISELLGKPLSIASHSTAQLHHLS